LSFTRFIAVIAYAILVGSAGALSWAQTNANAPSSPSTVASSSSKSAATPSPSQSAWQNLTALQRKALLPLAPHWAQLNAAQKNKWLAISTNFDNLAAKEQAVLHERMAAWASLSPQQRALARLSFNETKSMDADEKKSQWEAYQALSSADKKKLAAQQTTGIQGAATASKAPPPHKVMRLPGKSTPSSDKPSTTTGIVIDKKTLLPTTVTIPEGT
jgi:hypothetical protein